MWPPTPLLWPCRTLLCLLCVSVIVCGGSHSSSAAVAHAQTETQTMLGCYRREYTFKATRTDHKGRQCWDYLMVWSCWGRCDSYEIPDWRFPFKLSSHPVCVHDRKRTRHVTLRHCDPGAHPDLRHYRYPEAETCACQTCDSSRTSCEWKHHVHAEAPPPPHVTTDATEAPPNGDYDVDYSLNAMEDI